MFNFKKILIAIITFLIVGIAYFVFSSFVLEVSHPDDFQEYETPLIEKHVNIYRNYYGIPHIISQSENSAYFALGYCHASDRLWQMDYLRRIAEGRLSEIFGQSTVNTDKFMRLLDLRSVAEKSHELLDGATKKAIENYTKGVNFYLNKNYDALPIEFNIFDYEMDEWDPLDCALLFELYSFRNSNSFFMDVIFGMFAEKIGVENSMDIIPEYFPGPSVLSRNFMKEKISPNIPPAPSISDSLLQDTSLFKKLPILSNVFDLRSSRSPLTGTNALACRKTKQKEKIAIMANDLHSSLSLPCQWYQVHLTAKSINVAGMTLPGVPFVLSGRNDNISWGFSNMMLDDCDFFIHELAGENNRSFVSPTGEKEFVLKKDTIIVKDSIDIEFYKYYADGSVVLTKDVFDCQVKTAIDFPNSEHVLDFAGKYFFTFNWIGFEPSGELSNLFNLMHADNWKEFRRSLDKWGSPALNFVYCDNKGNIGLLPKGFVPIRKAKCNPRIPNPAWDDAYSWIRIEKNFSFGYLLNPDKKYVAAANNVLSHDFNTYLSSYYEPFSRAERIDEFFESVSDYGLKDIKQFQFDLLSPYAMHFRELVLPVLLDNYQKFEFSERQAFRIFRDWDCIMSPLSPAAALYSKFLHNTLNSMLSTYLNKENAELLMQNTNIAYIRLLEIISSENMQFGRLNESSIREIIINSFFSAMKELRKEFNTDNIEKWRYGELNTIEFDHFLTNLKIYDNIVKAGPYEIGGDFSTINYFQVFECKEMISNGTNGRIILSMADDRIYTSIAGGASGQPLSAHYSDQIQLLLNGGYVEIPMSKKPSDDFDLNVTFLPE